MTCANSGGAVFPAAFAITWRGQSKAGAISGAFGGLAAGLIAWLVVAKVYFGEISVSSTGENYSTLAGNLAAIMTGLIITVVVSLIKPQNFDWEITRAINAHSRVAGIAGVAPLDGLDGMDEGDRTNDPVIAADAKKEKNTAGGDSTPATPPTGTATTMRSEDEEMLADEKLEEHPSRLRGAFKLACWASFTMTFLMDFVASRPPPCGCQ